MKEGQYKTVEEAKQGLLEVVDKELEATGVYTTSSCPTGASFGWDMMQHCALEWFMRHPPEAWHISRIYRHECYDWTITQR